MQHNEPLREGQPIEPHAMTICSYDSSRIPPSAGSFSSADVESLAASSGKAIVRSGADCPEELEAPDSLENQM